MPFKMHKIIFFQKKSMCVPTLPKISRPVTRNTIMFYLALLVMMPVYMGPKIYMYMYIPNTDPQNWREGEIVILPTPPLT